MTVPTLVVYAWPKQWAVAWKRAMREESPYADVSDDEAWCVDGQLAAVGMGWA